MVKHAIFAVMLFCALTLGCTSVQESKLAGKWVCGKTGETMELAEDHSCMLYSIGAHYEGRWSLSKSDIEIAVGPIVLRGSFDGKNIVAEETMMHGKYIFEKVG